MYSHGLLGHGFPATTPQAHRCEPITFLSLSPWQLVRRSSLFSSTGSDRYSLDSPLYVHGVKLPIPHPPYFSCSSQKVFFLSQRSGILWNKLLRGYFPEDHNLNLFISSVYFLIFFTSFQLLLHA